MDSSLSAENIARTAAEPVERPSPSSITVIEPTRGWAALRLHELWEYRDLLYFMVWRDVKARYRQTAFGPIWIVAQPFVSMVLYTILFGQIAKLPSEGKPYALFSYAALLPWTFLASCVTSGTGSLLSSTALISKVYFPRLLIPLSQVISHVFDFVVSFLFLLVLMFVFQTPLTLGLIVIPPLLVMMAMLGVGIGLWFSRVIVRFRDFANIVGYGMRVWMYASPVVYSGTLVPAEWKWLYELNPMAGVIEAFRWAILGTAPPSMGVFGIYLLLIIPIFVGGIYYFKRVERSIIDVA